MKKAIIDYNFHNYQQSFMDRMKPIVDDAIYFIKEYVDESGGEIDLFIRKLNTLNGLQIGSVQKTSETCTVTFVDMMTSISGELTLDIEVVDSNIILQIAQYLYNH